MIPQGNRPALLDSPRVVDASAAAQPGPGQAAKAPNSEQAFFRLDLMRSLQLHRRLALSIAAVGFVLGLIFYLSRPPVYMAQCLVYVQPAPPSVIQQGYASRWPYDASTYDSYIQQQIGNAMREDVLTNALNKIGAEARKPDESDEDALNDLRKQLAVARVGQTYQFFIEARASSPELAAKTANAVASSYIESTTHDQRAGDQQRLTMLREERDRVQSALDADRAEQQELNKQLGVASISGAPDHFDQDITELHTELVKARTEHDAAAAKFAAMGANHGEPTNAIDAAADESAATDAGLVSMKTALNARKAVLISKMANLTPGNPEYKQDAAELAQINGNLDQMMKDLRVRAVSHIQLQLRSELERTGGVEAQLNTQLRQLVSNATNATSKLQRSSDLAADITRLQARYSSVDEQLHNLMLEDAAPTGAYVSTPADVPSHRAKSGRTRNAAVIVMAGLFLGLLAAVVRNKLDRRVYVGSDVESILGFGPMAMLPDFGEVSEGAAEEHLLRLAAAIEHAHEQGHLRSWVFTGSGSGTGVTTIVTRIRALLAAMGRPTVSVDASGTSGDEEPVGAPAAATQGTAALVATGAGRGLQSALSHQMVSESEDKTLVLTDSAPIAVSAETEYLARFADCAIVVIESGVTTRAEIRDAAATLQRLNVGAVGFVLNRIGKAKADHAFLASVDAIERHLQSQMGAVARRTRRTDAVVVAKTTKAIIKPAEVPSSVPVEQKPVAAASTESSGSEAASPASSSPQSASSQAASSPATSQQATSQSPETATEPFWKIDPERVTSTEPLDSKAWTRADSAVSAHEAQTQAGLFERTPAPPAEITPVDQASTAPFAARGVETPFGAQFFKTQPLASAGSMIWPEAASTSWQAAAPPAPLAAPVASQPATHAPQAGEPQRMDEPKAVPAQPTFDPSYEEQVRDSVRTEFQPAEIPSLATPVVHQSMWAQRERLPIPAQPEAPRGRELPTAPVAAIPPVEPEPEADPDIPWWLSDVPGQRAGQPTPFAWPGDLAAKSRKDATHPGPDPFERPLHADPSRNKRAVSPVQQPPREGIGSVQGRATSQPAQIPTHVAVHEDAPERLTSRLSGLRSLLTGLGLKEVHSPVGTAEAENQRRTSPASGSPAAEVSNRGLQGIGKSSPSQGQVVTPGMREPSAQPEFLKPATTDSEFQAEGARPGGKSMARTFQSGTEFEIPTLPSKRGQYRNL